MTPSAHTTPSAPHRLLVIGGTGFMGSRKATHLLRQRCDIVTFGSRSTAYRDVETIVDDDWLRKEKAASQSGNT